MWTFNDYMELLGALLGIVLFASFVGLIGLGWEALMNALGA